MEPSMMKSGRPKRIPFDWLREMSPSAAADCLLDERPQVVALVLAHLSAERAAVVLSQLGDDMRREVARRLGCMNPVDPDVVRQIDDVLARRSSQQVDSEDTGAVRIGDVRAGMPACYESCF